jgi:hypothetical protein
LVDDEADLRHQRRGKRHPPNALLMRRPTAN